MSRITWKELWQLQTKRSRRIAGLLWIAMGTSDIIAHILRGHTAVEDFLFGFMYVACGIGWFFIPYRSHDHDLTSLNLNSPRNADTKDSELKANG